MATRFRHVGISCFLLAVVGCGDQERIGELETRVEGLETKLKKLEAQQGSPGSPLRRVMDDADNDSAQIQVDHIAKACTLFKLQVGRVPSDLMELLHKPADVPSGRNWRGPYLDKIPDDPWDRPFQYTADVNEKTFEVRCAGIDGEFNTDDDEVSKG